MHVLWLIGGTSFPFSIVTVESGILKRKKEKKIVTQLNLNKRMINNFIFEIIRR